MGFIVEYKCKKCGYVFWGDEAEAYRKFKGRDLLFKQVSTNGYAQINYCPKCDEKDNFEEKIISVCRDLPDPDFPFWWKPKSS